MKNHKIKTMNKYFFILITLLLVQACKDEEIAMMMMPPIDPCDIGLESHLIPASETSDSSTLACENCFIDCQEVFSDAIPYDYSYPCFNPNNGEQLAYYRYVNSVWSPTWELWVKDFCTGEKKMLTDKALYGLDWSVNDWLTYTAWDQNIWKIKSNGDSLTQLTFAGSFNRHPKWSPDGTKICYQHKQGGELSIFILIDPQGTAIDTLTKLNSIGKWSWIDKNRICFTSRDTIMPNTSNLNYYNLETGQIQFLHHLERENNNDLLVQSTSYLPKENSILWAAFGTLGKTNLTTGSFEIIRERLFQERFHFLTIRPNGEEIVVNKSSRSYTGNCHFDSEVEFYLMDTNGDHQKRINMGD